MGKKYVQILITDFIVKNKLISKQAEKEDLKSTKDSQYENESTFSQ